MLAVHRLMSIILLKWHDQEFAKQVDVNKQLNIQQYFLFKLASITIDEAIGFAILGAAALMLGIFHYICDDVGDVAYWEKHS